MEAVVSESVKGLAGLVRELREVGAVGDGGTMVDCACGARGDLCWSSDGEAWIECVGECGRVGPTRKTRIEAVEAWRSDQHALKHFDAVVEALMLENEHCTILKTIGAV